jgi:alcohol dehydrogenase-like protein
MSVMNVFEEKSNYPVPSKPSLHEVPGGTGVLVKVLRVGVHGADQILPGQSGATHPGYDFLVFGHAGFGRVEDVGPQVRQLKPGDYAVATSRRPFQVHSSQLASDAMSEDGVHDDDSLSLLTEYYVADARFTVRVPDDLRHVGGLLEPSSSGTAVISGKTSALLFEASARGIPISPLSLNPRLPWKLEEIIGKLLKKDNRLCYQGADELRSILARLVRPAGSDRMKALRTTLAWRRPGARWRFAPAGRYSLLISGLFRTAQCEVARTSEPSYDRHRGADWISPETPACAQASEGGFMAIG